MERASMRLELIPLLASDVDAATTFYTDVVGFDLDHDIRPGNGMRIVQLTPPGSACSIVLGVGDTVVHGIHLVVDDVAATSEALRSRGAVVSDIQDMGGVLYAYFSDPDGNSWALQEIPAHAAPQ